MEQPEIDKWSGYSTPRPSASPAIRWSCGAKLSSVNSMDSTANDLVSRWREQAAAYERDGQPGAKLLRRVADELENMWSDWYIEPLTIAQAARESGYTEDYLRDLVRDGTLHAVRFADRGPIRIRRCDCPRKAGHALKAKV